MLKHAQEDIDKVEEAAAKEEQKAARRQTMAFGGERHGTKCDSLSLPAPTFRSPHHPFPTPCVVFVAGVGPDPALPPRPTMDLGALKGAVGGTKLLKRAGTVALS